jgi:4-carboxymuconolactone decarboxylase
VDRNKGAQIRREVLGAAHVDKMNAVAVDPFYQNFVDFTEEFCWGNVWVRPGLERKTRSLLNLAMLSVMARWHEFEIHVRGALNNGVTKEEIAEVLVQAGVYGGIPIASEGFKAARRVFDAIASES